MDETIRAGSALPRGMTRSRCGRTPADSEFCYRLAKAARAITPADPEYAKRWRRYHETL